MWQYMLPGDFKLHLMEAGAVGITSWPNTVELYCSEAGHDHAGQPRSDSDISGLHEVRESKTITEGWFLTLSLGFNQNTLSRIADWKGITNMR